MFISDLNISQILENADSSQYINADLINNNLRYNANIIAVNQLSSTNTVLKNLAELGAEDKTVIIADRQTKGKGRAGKSFYSPNRTGIYMSVLMRKSILSSLLGYVTPAAAVAVSNALKSYGFDTKIKWVNDIFISDKKVCGILTSTSLKSNENYSEYTVIGIGLNLEPPDDGFPDEIKNVATNLYKHCSREIKHRIICDILNNLFEILDRFDIDEIISTYKNDSYLDGKTIIITQGEKSFTAKAIRLDEKLNLVVSTSSGETVSINFGDVSIATENI